MGTVITFITWLANFHGNQWPCLDFISLHENTSVIRISTHTTKFIFTDEKSFKMVFILEVLLVTAGATCLAASNIVLVTQQISRWLLKKKQIPKYLRKYKPCFKDQGGFLYYWEHRELLRVEKLLPLKIYGLYGLLLWTSENVYWSLRMYEDTFDGEI